MMVMVIVVAITVIISQVYAYTQTPKIALLSTYNFMFINYTSQKLAKRIRCY